MSNDFSPWFIQKVIVVHGLQVKDDGDPVITGLPDLVNCGKASLPLSNSEVMSWKQLVEHREATSCYQLPTDRETTG